MGTAFRFQLPIPFSAIHFYLTITGCCSLFRFNTAQGARSLSPIASLSGTGMYGIKGSSLILFFVSVLFILPICQGRFYFLSPMLSASVVPHPIPKYHFFGEGICGCH
uniref:Uncharacterized protein n=2 Tax=Rhizophora mucronata TaxID=61149 RepID=A0A2P2KMV7_RHIMU